MVQKILLISVILIMALILCSCEDNPTSTSTSVSTSVSTTSQTTTLQTTKSVTALAISQLGKKKGTGDFDGIDWAADGITYCDRFVAAVVKVAFGIHIDNPNSVSGFGTAYAHYLAHESAGVVHHDSSPPEESIVYYEPSPKYNGCGGHVGIYVGGNYEVISVVNSDGVNSGGLNSMGADFIGWVSLGDYFNTLQIKPSIELIPNTPTALSPGASSENEIQTINTLTPTLTWASVEGADHYTVFISEYPYGESHIIYSSYEVHGTSIVVPSSELSWGVKYRWNLQAIGHGGCSSEYSNRLYFQTEKQDGSDVNLTLYVYENDINGPGLVGVSITGQDGDGTSFDVVTNSSCYVIITGTPGEWYFTASKDGYKTKSWHQPITTTCAREVYLIVDSEENNVTLTLYVHANIIDGPLITGVNVSGYDGDNTYFFYVTNPYGYVTINGTPGTWNFTASKSGYETKSWPWDITSTTTKDIFLVKKTSSVTLTLCVHEDWLSGPVIAGVNITGEDEDGTSFNEITDSSGCITLVGAPGTWNFTASKSGYNTKTWSQDITETKTVDIYLEATEVGDVILTLYIHEGSTSGPGISGVNVYGEDGDGTSFEGVTNASGYVLITGTPGTWHITAAKSGYTTKSWYPNITSTHEEHAYLVLNSTPHPPTIVSVKIGPYPGQEFLQVHPGDSYRSWFKFSYSGPNVVLCFRTSILDSEGHIIGTPCDCYLTMMGEWEDPYLQGAECVVPEDAALGIYNIEFSIWKGDFSEEYDSFVGYGWLEVLSGSTSFTLDANNDNTSVLVIFGAVITSQDMEDNLKNAPRVGSYRNKVHDYVYTEKPRADVENVWNMTPKANT